MGSVAGNLEASEKWLKAALPSGGETAAEAAHLLARVKLKQHQPAEALAVVEQALPPSKASGFAVHLLLDQADATYDLDGRRGEAIGLYAALAKNHAQHALAPQQIRLLAKPCLFSCTSRLQFGNQ